MFEGGNRDGDEIDTEWGTEAGRVGKHGWRRVREVRLVRPKQLL
jgi:hypothetical protein